MNDFETIIRNRTIFLCGNGNTPQHIVQKLNEQTDFFLADFNTNFLKFNSIEQKENVEHLLQRYRNLHTLAKVVCTAGTAYYHDSGIIAQIVGALHFLHTEVYNCSCHEHTNWWQWEIGFALLIHDILILLQPHLLSSFIEEILTVTRFFQPSPILSGNNPVAIHPSGKPLRVATGANRVDIVKVCLFRAALQKNAGEIQECLQALPVVWQLKTYSKNQHGEDRDGFYADGTFIQHGDIPYNGTYGNVLLSGLGEILQTLCGTIFEEHFSDTAELYERIESSFLPFLYKGIFPDMFNGRSITRRESDHVVGHRIINSLLLLTQTAQKEVEPYIERIQSVLKRELKSDTAYNHQEREQSPYFYFLTQDLLTNKNILASSYDEKTLFLPEGERFFYCNSDFALGVALHSCRVANYESFNGENTCGWFTGDGAVYLYDQPDNYTDFWSSIDWYSIPGTTETRFSMEGVCAIRGECTRPASRNPSSFTVGCGSQNRGVLRMDFHNWNDTLTSTKQWTFLSDGFLYEESAICSKYDAYMTIEHKIILDVNSLFIGDQKIAAEEQLLSGCYNRFCVDGRIYTIKIQKPVFIQLKRRNKKLFFTAWIEYAAPQNESCVWLLTLV